MLAVTSQDPGPDGIDGTNDDITAPLNLEPAHVSVDFVANSGCGDPMDRVRNFGSLHPGGALFLFADGSVHFLDDNVDLALYQNLSRTADRQPPGEF